MKCFYGFLPLFFTSFLEARTGTLDMQRVILSVEEGQNKKKELETKIQKKQEIWEKEKKRLSQLEQDWKEKSSLLSEKARDQKRTEIEEKILSLRQEEMSFREEIAKIQNDTTQKIASKSTHLLEKIVLEDQVDQVFEMNHSALLYAKDSVDLTQKVIDAYEKEYGKKK